MKTNLFKALAFIMGMVMSTSLIACGSDDDEPNTPNPSKEVASYDISYMAEVTEAYLEYYDVTVSYVDSNGATKTEALTAKKSFGINVPANVMPSKVNLTIHATLKDPLPGYNDETICTFGCSYQVLVNKVYNDNSTEIVGGDLIPNTHNLTVKGDKLANYFAKYADFNIASKTVDVK